MMNVSANSSLLINATLPTINTKSHIFLPTFTYRKLPQKQLSSRDQLLRLMMTILTGGNISSALNNQTMLNYRGNSSLEDEGHLFRWRNPYKDVGAAASFMGGAFDYSNVFALSGVSQLMTDMLEQFGLTYFLIIVMAASLIFSLSIVGLVFWCSYMNERRKCKTKAGENTKAQNNSTHNNSNSDGLKFEEHSTAQETTVHIGNLNKAQSLPNTGACLSNLYSLNLQQHASQKYGFSKLPKMEKCVHAERRDDEDFLPKDPHVILIEDDTALAYKGQLKMPSPIV
ncbi:uncharacterized protein LOC142341494 isoform X2 [Convolutriloba macropyga]|uniref:uncharacterized protein LOC142341494 isoform X2 n=1 Tax=Convolutriloba macropyga TaxID=536237 RepID=UPI003F51FE59